MDHILGGETPGPLGTCASCGTQGRMFVHASEGWIDRKCFLAASTVIEIRWIRGAKFTRCLKGLAPKTKPATSSQVASIRKE